MTAWINNRKITYVALTPHQWHGREHTKQSKKSSWSPFLQMIFPLLFENRTLVLKRRLSPCYCGALCYQGPTKSDSNGGFPILAHKYMDDSQNTKQVNVDHFAQHQSAQLISFVSNSIRTQTCRTFQRYFQLLKIHNSGAMCLGTRVRITQSDPFSFVDSRIFEMICFSEVLYFYLFL